jgi:hypothetical protein
MAEDYPPIEPVGDDEEERKRKLLAVSQVPSSAPSAPPIVPPNQPITAPEVAPPPIKPMNVSGPNLQKDIMAGSVSAPQSSQYTPVEPSKGKTILNRIAAGMVGFRNPGEGVDVRRRFEQEPQRVAQQNLANDTNQYNTAFTQGIQGQNAASETALRGAQAEHLGAETAALKNPQPKPKEEVWKVVPGVQGPNGEPMQEEQNSGQMRVAPGGASVTEKNAGKPSEVDKDVSDYLASKGLPDTPANREKARESRAARDRPPVQGSFMPLYGKDGQVVGAWNPANGQVQHAPALPGTTSQGVGQQDKAAAAVDKKIAPYKAVVDEAEQAAALKDMGDKGNAEADVGLALTFFKAMRSGTTGGSGIRFTQQENNLIMDSRNLWGSLEVKGNKLLSNGQPLSREQRKEIFDVITVYKNAAQRHIQEAQGGGTQSGGTPTSGGGGGGGKVLVEGKDF